MIAVLTGSDLADRIAELGGWDFDDAKGALHRRFEFADFSQAWSFMSRVALLAEQLDHHPEWLNNYNALDIWLRSDTAGKITTLDVILARAIDGLALPRD